MDESLKDKIIKLRHKGRTYKEIVDTLGCSLSVVSFHCTNAGITDIGLKCHRIEADIIEKIREYYLTHTLKETAENFKISVPTVKKYVDKKRILLSKKEAKQRRINSVTNRRRKIKEIAVEYKGGKCVRCGYDKYIGALDFHHLNPKEKDFSISGSGHCKSWDKIKKELDKCILVCANCHREIHNEIKMAC